MAAIDGDVGGGRMGRAALFGQIEEQRDLGCKAFLPGFQRQQIVGPARRNGSGDPGLGAHRRFARTGGACRLDVDRDQRTFQVQPVQLQGYRGDFVRFRIRCLLAEHQPLALGPGRNHVQRVRPAMGAARGLAVYDYDVRFGLAQAIDPP